MTHLRKMIFTAILLALVACYPYVWDERCLRAAAEYRGWRPD